VLTNAMRPMMKVTEPLLAAQALGGERLVIRVSIDHYTKDLHELERGPRSWAPTIAGLRWLVDKGVHVHVAARSFSGQPEAEIRRGFARLFAAEGIPIDAQDPVRLMVFPEMDPAADVPEITDAC